MVGIGRETEFKQGKVLYSGQGHVDPKPNPGSMA